MPECSYCNRDKKLSRGKDICIDCDFALRFLDDYPNDVLDNPTNQHFQGNLLVKDVLRTKVKNYPYYAIHHARPGIDQEKEGFTHIILSPGNKLWVSNRVMFNVRVWESAFPQITPETPYSIFVKSVTIYKHLPATFALKGNETGNKYFLYQGAIGDIQCINPIWIEVPAFFDPDHRYHWMYISPVNDWKKYDQLCEIHRTWKTAHESNYTPLSGDEYPNVLAQYPAYERL